MEWHVIRRRDPSFANALAPPGILLCAFNPGSNALVSSRSRIDSALPIHDTKATMTKTYAQITREIQALQASADKLRATELKSTIAKLNEMIATYGLTEKDLHFPASASTPARRQRPSSSASARSRRSSDAKYGDGKGNTWGGRGPRPAWLKQGLKKRGSSIDDFLISARTDAPAEAPKATPAKAPVVAPASPASKGGGKSNVSSKTSPKASAKPAKAPAATRTIPSGPTARPPAKKVVQASKVPDAANPVPAKKAPTKGNLMASAKKPNPPKKARSGAVAPAADAAPAPSTVPVAAPMPAPQSGSVEGRGDIAGT